jgi:hypothetical protein
VGPDPDVATLFGKHHSSVAYAWCQGTLVQEYQQPPPGPLRLFGCLQILLGPAPQVQSSHVGLASQKWFFHISYGLGSVGAMRVFFFASSMRARSNAQESFRVTAHFTPLVPRINLTALPQTCHLFLFPFLCSCSPLS